MTGPRTMRAVFATTLVVVVVLVVSIPVASASFSSATPSASNSWATAAVFPRWVDVAVGRDHACGVERAGGVWCWGSISNGANGSWSDQYTPRRVTGGFPVGTRFVAVTAGYDHTCALTDGGRAWCWGGNWNGQLGSATNLSGTTTTPQQVTITTMTQPLVAISAGFEHTCSVDVDARAWCWGKNDAGQLGINSPDFSRANPAAVATLGTTVSAVSAGQNHTCAVSTSGTGAPRAWCWGEQDSGRLGNGLSAVAAVRSPIQVSTTATRMPGDIEAVSAGLVHSCAVQKTGGAWCWGVGSGGRLGNGGTANHSVPQAVTSPLAFVGIEAGLANSCAFRSAGEASCWGRAQDGEIGDGPASTTPQPPTDPSARLTPSPVTRTNMSARVSRIESGQSFTCALALGDVWCWGRNDHGRLGAGTLWEIYDNPQKVPD